MAIDLIRIRPSAKPVGSALSGGRPRGVTIWVAYVNERIRPAATVLGGFNSLGGFRRAQPARLPPWPQAAGVGLMQKCSRTVQ